jgi:hypothetical protein
MGNHRLEALRESVVAGLVDTAPPAIAMGWRGPSGTYWIAIPAGTWWARHVLERDLWNALLYERHWQEVELHWHVAAVLDGIEWC